MLPGERFRVRIAVPPHSRGNVQVGKAAPKGQGAGARAHSLTGGSGPATDERIGKWEEW